MDHSSFRNSAFDQISTSEEAQTETNAMEEEQGDGGERSTKKKRSVITIPSYEEVIQSSQSKSNPSLFVPSQTFSQAFSYLKSSEFYSPPSTSASAVSNSFSTSHTSQPPESTSFRHVGQDDAAASTSTFVAPPTPAAKSTFPTSNQNRNTILVSHRQKGNPLLKQIRNVKWEFADVVCDYLLGQSSCALYLSLRYHLLHPDYLYYRIRELQKNFKLRVVLCLVDVEDAVKPLHEVTKTALLHDCTLLCGWSLEECGRYLETIKVYENKPADIIQGQMDTDYVSRLTHTLTSVRHVNKTDVVTLGTTFGSLSHIMDASMEDLARCPGIGERKVKRLYDTFHEPFKLVGSSRPAIPEAPANNAACSTAEEKQDEQDINNGRKKEPELTVKSALSAAFARYTDRVGKKNNDVKEDERGETSVPKE